MGAGVWAPRWCGGHVRPWDRPVQQFRAALASDPGVILPTSLLSCRHHEVSVRAGVPRLLANLTAWSLRATSPVFVEN